MARIPFLIVGDHPTQATGLARILGDIARRMHAEYADLLDVRTCGWAPWADLPLQGVEVEQASDVFTGSLTPFPHWVFSSTRQDWGSHAAVTAYRRWWGDQDGFLLTVWDPGRCLEYSRIPLPVTKWGYFAIDAANVNGGISGPAADAVRGYDRVLAYTKFGARVLARVGNDLTIPHLPHGLDLGTFQPIADDTRSARARQILRVPDGRQVIGCVATNQPRKDWGLVAQVIKCLVNFGYPLHLWAHTDRVISEAWSLPQLFADCGLADRVTLTPPMGDRDLAACYAACIATIAPGRGEGFCYPAAESLASGTPCFGAKHSGLAELLPAEWQLEPELEHLVGPYALGRPILDPEELALRVERYVLAHPGPVRWMERRDQSLAAVRHLDWTVLWPQWKAWIDRGLGRG